jgi:AcrR family transcriptional regulator
MMTQRVQASAKLIVSAARDLARVQGWSSVSVRKIADQIQYKAPVIYEFFENKEALIAQVVAEGYRELRFQIAQVWKEQTKKELSLVLISIKYYEFASANSEVYAAMNLEGSFKEGHKAIGDEREGFCREVSEMIGEWARGNGVNHIDCNEVTEVLWALLHGIVSLGLSKQLGDSRSIRKIIESSVLYLEQGIKAGK